MCSKKKYGENMNLKTIFITFISLLILLGCSPNTATTLKHAQNNYYAKTIDDLVMDIGVPQSKYEMDNGNMMYKWVYSGTINMPSTTTYNSTATAYGTGNTATAYGSGTATTFGGGISNRVCEITVLANSSNVIKNIKFNQDTFGTKPFATSMCAQMFGIF
jgi:hypothetical protein